MAARQTVRVAVLALLLASAGCGRHDSEGILTPDLSSAAGEGDEASAAAHLDLREVRAALLAADRGYAEAAAATNILDGLTAAFADDVRYIPFGFNIVTGRAATRAFLAGNPANAVSSFTWTAVRADVSSDGTGGYTYGYTELHIPPTGTLPAQTRVGKYIAFWKRGGAGWKIVAFVRNPRPEGAVSTTPPAGFETPDEKHHRYFPNTDPATALQQMMATDRAFSDAGQSGLPGAFVSYAAEDGAVLGGPASIVFGAQSIRDDIEPPPTPYSFTWAPLEGDAAASGDLGYTIGRALTEDPTGADPNLYYSHYLTIWQRQNTGEWRFVMDGGGPEPGPGSSRINARSEATK
jgi:ketosteroid isomerase-like protein